MNPQDTNQYWTQDAQGRWIYDNPITHESTSIGVGDTPASYLLRSNGSNGAQTIEPSVQQAIMQRFNLTPSTHNQQGVVTGFGNASLAQGGQGVPTPQSIANEANVFAQQQAVIRQQNANEFGIQHGTGTTNPWGTAQNPPSTPNSNIGSQLGAISNPSISGTQGAIPTTNSGVGNSTSGNQYTPGQTGASFGAIPQEQQRQSLVNTDPNNITGYQNNRPLST